MANGSSAKHSEALKKAAKLNSKRTSEECKQQNTNTEVFDINAYVARFFMSFAIGVARLPFGTMCVGLMILIVFCYGISALFLAFCLISFHTLWTFRVYPLSHHCKARDSLNVLLGRSWKLSHPDPVMRSNNNVSMFRFQGKYIAAYRNADRHWPSEHASMVVASADHPSGPWQIEWQHRTGQDLREMMLFELDGQLFLYYCGIGSEMLGSFNVEGTRCFVSSNAKDWEVLPGRNGGLVSRPGELIWDVKVVQKEGQSPVVYKTSYLGGHYQATGHLVSVLFEQSNNALDWRPCGSSKDGIVYKGGICEVSFEFTRAGDLVAIGRNEDGDDTGFGSQLFFARKSDLGSWQALKVSLPWRFDSPRMVRAEATGDILLFARHTYNKYELGPRRFSRVAQQ
jgi:hypothetical protein